MRRGARRRVRAGLSIRIRVPPQLSELKRLFAITSFWISLVPSPIVQSLTSR